MTGVQTCALPIYLDDAITRLQADIQADELMLKRLKKRKLLLKDQIAWLENALIPDEPA